MPFILYILFVFVGCTGGVQNQLVTWTGQTMGTTYSVKVLTAPDGAVLPGQGDVDKILAQVNQSMSTYIKDSEISLINFSSEPIKEKAVTEGFAHVLDYALELSKSTDGVYDPTIGPLVNLWGFGPSAEKKVPSKEEIEKAKMRVGFQYVSLDKAARKLTLKKDNMYLDFSSLAKGYGVDLIAEFLLKRRLTDFMVEIGGEVRTSGTNNGRAWRVGIETPDVNKRSIQKILEINDVAMATSGNYRNFFENAGKRYSHTIDFKTGEPVKFALASVTVLHKESCMKADALATALMAMERSKAMEYAKENNIAALFVYPKEGTKEFITKANSSFNQLVKK
ncbi:MAG: FAD:protein FMN transferase [Bacteriovoracaceae bacterium]